MAIFKSSIQKPIQHNLELSISPAKVNYKEQKSASPKRDNLSKIDSSFAANNKKSLNCNESNTPTALDWVIKPLFKQGDDQEVTFQSVKADVFDMSQIKMYNAMISSATADEIRQKNLKSQKGSKARN